MSKKNILIVILTAVFLAGAAAAGYYFLWLPQANRAKPAAALADPLFGWKFPAGVLPAAQPSPVSGQNLFDFQIAYSSIRDPGGIPSGLPVRLQIPVIGVNAAIEDAVITPDGRMDVPAGSVNVAWFALGPHPGQVGSAVIGGHFGIDNGIKFVFYDLDKLKVGDKVYILDDENNTLAFQVRRIQLFDRNADATTVFTSTDGLAHLNLITCEGVWNQVNGAYPLRRVVFTDSIPSEGPVTVNPFLPVVGTPAPPAPLPTPAPVVKPVPAPVPIKIPTPAISLTPTSSPAATAASATATPTPEALPAIVVPIAAALPTPAAATVAPPSTLIQSAKNSYATPLDGLTTSSLLISIVFLGFKIISSLAV